MPRHVTATSVTSAAATTPWERVTTQVCPCGCAAIPTSKAAWSSNLVGSVNETAPGSAVAALELPFSILRPEPTSPAMLPPTENCWSWNSQSTRTLVTSAVAVPLPFVSVHS